MTSYLKIENPGVCPPEGFTLLGASNSRGNNDFIGKFGTGNKHGINVCLRNNANPIIYSSNLCLNFFTKPTPFQNKTIHKLFVKINGKDEFGKSINRTDDLNRVTEFGEEDWPNIELGLREFVSNALDGALYQALLNENINWCNQQNIPNDTRKNLPENIWESLSIHLKDFANSVDYWNHVKIEIVAENKVRAKSGCTRVFVPMNNDVFKFFNHIDQWFLHFQNPELLRKNLLPKQNPKSTAKIYKKGVFVRNWNSSDHPSLFDYNINELKIDECRTANDWECRYYSALALANSNADNIEKFVESLQGDNLFWEHEFEPYGLTNVKANQLTIWMNAFNKITNNKGVISKGTHADAVQRKGYQPIKVNDGVYQLLEKAGAKRTIDVLSNNELLQRTIQPPSQNILNAFHKIYQKLHELNLTQHKPVPNVFQFTSNMNSGSTTFGFQENDAIFINSVLDGKSIELDKVILEEIAHYLTDALDETRDLQDWAFLVAAKLL